MVVDDVAAWIWELGLSVGPCVVVGASVVDKSKGFVNKMGDYFMNAEGVGNPFPANQTM